ncbi:hypothetical protein GQ600_9038 [Phytophthora cactorum]|nr:hypothetical protein GQ600_9038 [Phytophthora cactorum]
MVDSTPSTEVEQTVKDAQLWNGNHRVAQLTVLDDEPGCYDTLNFTFTPGAVYLIPRVEYVSTYDGDPNDNGQYERSKADKIRELEHLLNATNTSARCSCTFVSLKLWSRSNMARVLQESNCIDGKITSGTPHQPTDTVEGSRCW